jgi:hypothetical protein
MLSNKDHAVYADFFSSKPNCKFEGYHTVWVQYVAVSCCLPAKQVAKGKQFKLLPTKDEDQRLAHTDHATKLEASRPRCPDLIFAEIEVSQRGALRQHSCKTLSECCDTKASFSVWTMDFGEHHRRPL